MDLGSTTGWSFHDGTTERFGAWELTGSHPHRLHMLSLHVSAFVREHAPTVIAYEEIFFGTKDSIASRRLLTQMMGFVDVIAYRMNIPRRLINPHDIKRSTCGIMISEPAGKRRAIKPDVVAVINARRAATITNHNVADALAMLDLLRAEHRAGYEHQAVPRSVMIAAALKRTTAKRARRQRKLL